MPINEDLMNLPRAGMHEGNPPASDQFVAIKLAEAWHESDHAEQARAALERAIPEAGPFRASWFQTRCDRQLWYLLRDTEETEPNDLADTWRFGLGHVVHNMLQEVIEDMYPGAESEVEVDMNPAGVPGSAHMDIVIEHKGMKLGVEIKTKNGFGFKMAASKFNGPPEGPSRGEVLQAAIPAKAKGLDGVVIVYLSLENLSKQWAFAWTDHPASKFAAEWHYTIEELEPMIKQEVERVNGLIKAAANPDCKPVPRQVTLHSRMVTPDGAVVQDPENGMAVKLEGPGSRVIEWSGDVWDCHYCNFKTQCQKDGA